MKQERYHDYILRKIKEEKMDKDLKKDIERLIKDRDDKKEY